MKRIVLCADDYGQEPAISAGIISLIKAERLTAVSCMVNTPFWNEHAAWLKPYLGQADIGLHLNLSEGRPLSSQFKSSYGETFSTLPELMRRSVFRQIDYKALVSEVRAQLDAFEQALGCTPDFIDGHQHVHHFPVVREALLAVYQERFASVSQKPYVRSVDINLKSMGWIKNIKKLIIYCMGVPALKRSLKAHQIPFNRSFSGIYNFDESVDYAALFPAFLRQVSDNGLIMCHPGDSQSADSSDAIAGTRPIEQQYFLSEAFVQTLRDQQAVLSRFVRA